LVEGTANSTWVWVVASLLVAALCYGLVRTLFGTKPSLAAATTVAVAMALLIGIGLELLGYQCGKAIRFALRFFAPASSLGIFAFVLGRYIHRARTKVFIAGVSIVVGMFVLLVIGLPMGIYIGCRFGECINL
jgi:hypothetical protein